MNISIAIAAIVLAFVLGAKAALYADKREMARCVAEKLSLEQCDRLYFNWPKP